MKTGIVCVVVIGVLIIMTVNHYHPIWTAIGSHKQVETEEYPSLTELKEYLSVLLVEVENQRIVVDITELVYAREVLNRLQDGTPVTQNEIDYVQRGVEKGRFTPKHLYLSKEEIEFLFDKK